ncbi:MAG: hypothetical protein K0V04_14100 [Deltaproteobacteria bacterium]|nr:hypothetical protein [Deltaproteobacteria bacterium]
MLALLGSSVACEIDGSIGRAGRDATASIGGGSGGTPESGTHTDGTGSDNATTGAGGGGGTGTGGSSGGQETGATDVPAACHPTPDDNACAVCRKLNCCGALQECIAVDTCLCWWQCASTDQTTEQCVMSCNTDGLLYATLSECAQSNCDTCPADML